ncbi:MAG: DUF3575 domain-containing protein [Bacteroides sp.]|nr:DUF3575 domain-containing protein [Bacteroides sp.]MCM1379236.1 DUF3575 domain-containing protein [Bacteroides sp.]MCM1445106.1 DUF3575 domain-containing protein [Prevotella sp.]
MTSHTLRAFFGGIFAALGIAVGAVAPAKTMTTESDSVKIHFPQSKWHLDLQLKNNAQVLDSIDRKLSGVLNGTDTVWNLRHVSVIGGASPEGSVQFNEFLSEHRAETLFNWFRRYKPLNDKDIAYTYLGRDWEGVLKLADEDPGLPYAEETISLLRNIIAEKRLTGKEPANSLARIKRLRGGEPYRYLYHHIFPEVRASQLIVDYEKEFTTEIAELAAVEEVPLRIDTVYIERVVHDTIYVYDCHECTPFYMDIQTDMLFDALALPNIGVEFYLGKNISLGLNWMYAWWSRNRTHHYWRAYGGELYGRWWFGKAAHRKPLTGHHLGVYGQLYTYDFEWGGRGYLGGKPGGTLWDKAHWGVGVEYGYSLPVTKRLNIDFNIGFGYNTGIYHEYNPEDNCYVWDSTKRRHWFGPNKAGITLVWLIGCDNWNRK